MNSQASKQIRKFPYIATVLLVIGVGVLVSLGMWQLQRLEWKQNILQSIAVEQFVNAQEVQLDASIIEDAAGDQYPYKRGYVDGVFVSSDPVFIGPRTHDGNVGFHAILPFRFVDGSAIFVNLGWIEDKDNLRPVYRRLVRLQGHVKDGRGVSRFVPQNTPETDNWFRADVNDLALHYGIDAPLPLIFYSEVPGLMGGVLPHDPKVEINNNHLQYAIFWFIMAAVMIAVYVLRFFWFKSS